MCLPKPYVFWYFIFKAYHNNMYGARYQWFIPGWYSDDWYQINDTSCNEEQMIKSVLYTLTTNTVDGDMSGEKTISGQVIWTNLSFHSCFLGSLVIIVPAPTICSLACQMSVCITLELLVCVSIFHTISIVCFNNYFFPIQQTWK